MENAGTARRPRTATPSRTLPIARRFDIGRIGGTTAGAACDASRARSRPLRTRSPMRLSRAGVKVSAMSTAMATHAAPTLPMTPRKGMPVTLSARRAMKTVMPAKTTAVPEVAVARLIDSRRS